MYDLDTIMASLEQLGVRVSRRALQTELDRPMFEPELDRMIAVSDRLSELPRSTRYGLFTGMSEKNEYEISSGRYKYARALSVEEITKCY